MRPIIRLCRRTPARAGWCFASDSAIVLIGGAELFTSNNLIVMAWASGKVSTKDVMRNWMIVYCGNLVGSVGLVVLVFLSHHLDMQGGRVGLSVLNTAAGKIAPDMGTLFFKGILCNMLVCMGVWIAYAGHTVSDKILGLILPISAFVAAGFEHCVANMYFLPLAWVLAEAGKSPAAAKPLRTDCTGLPFHSTTACVEIPSRCHRRRCASSRSGSRTGGWRFFVSRTPWARR